MSDQKDVVAIGSICVDIIMGVSDVMRFETFQGNEIKKYTAIEYSSKVNVKSIKFAPGGSAANISSDLSMIGLKTRYLGIVGNDLNGDISVEDLEKRGVDISKIKRTDKDVTGASVVLMSGWGKDRSILAYKGSVDLITPDYIQEEMIKDFKALAWTSLTSESGAKTIEKAIGIAKNNNILVCACPSISMIKKRKEDAIRLVKRSDITSLNREELEEITGEGTTIKGIKKLISWGLKKVSVTLGNKGSRITDGKQLIESHVYDVKITDTTGAGDAFASGFIYGCINDLPLEETAKYASALSSLEIMGVGVRIGVPDSIEELQEFINTHNLEQTEIELKDVIKDDSDE